MVPVLYTDCDIYCNTGQYEQSTSNLCKMILICYWKPYTYSALQLFIAANLANILPLPQTSRPVCW